MKNVVLDVNVVIDILARRKPHESTSTAALRAALDSGLRLWLVASTLPTLLYVLEIELKTSGHRAGRDQDVASVSSRARRALARFQQEVSVLSAHGFDAEGLFESRDPEDALISRAADALGQDTVILTRDADFLGEDPRAVHPARFAELVHDERSQARKIPFVDLETQQQRLLPQIERNVHRVLRHGKYIMGPEVQELEETLADYVGVKHAIGCSSGTDALLMALMAFGVGPGDAIFTTPFTFIATAEVIALLGATPVFVDIDPVTYNISPAELEISVQALKANDQGIYPLPVSHRESPLTPKGVIAVDLYGLPADYDALQAICDEHGLFLIEDAAQSFGAEYKGRKACSLADVAATSFFPAKPLGCYGDGGMVFTNGDDLAETMRSIRIHGKGTDKYDNVRVGLNGRLDTLQAAVVLAKWEDFQRDVERRQEAAGTYTKLLEKHARTRFRTPSGIADVRSAWAQYTIRDQAGQRSGLQAFLQTAGIPTAVYYSTPLHLQPVFADLGYREDDFSRSEEASSQVLSLPFGPRLSRHDIDMVVEVMGAAARPGCSGRERPG